MTGFELRTSGVKGDLSTNCPRPLTAYLRNLNSKFRSKSRFRKYLQRMIIMIIRNITRILMAPPSCKKNEHAKIILSLSLYSSLSSASVYISLFLSRSLSRPHVSIFIALYFSIYLPPPSLSLFLSLVCMSVHLGNCLSLSHTPTHTLSFFPMPIYLSLSHSHSLSLLFF